MLHRWYRSVGAILAVLLTAAALPWAAAQSAGSVEPGASIAGIPLGEPIQEIVHRLGAPSAVRLVSPDGVLAYAFGQFGITVYVRDNAVTAVSTTNSILGTVRGIGMGASEDVVIAAFGRPRVPSVVEGFPGILNESLGIAFGFDRGSVAVVMVFAPHGAAVPAGPAPQPAPAVTTQTRREGTSEPAATTPQDGLAGAPAESMPAAGGAITAPHGPAVPGAAAGIPDVSRLHPYTAETRFLSLAGYLRYLVYGVTRQWVSAVDTIQLVIRQAGGAPVP